MQLFVKNLFGSVTPKENELRAGALNYFENPTALPAWIWLSDAT